MIIHLIQRRTMFMLSFHFCINIWFFSDEANLYWFFIICLYLFCHWRVNYHERGGWDAINRFNTANFLCLFQAKIWISYVMVFFIFTNLM